MGISVCRIFFKQALEPVFTAVEWVLAALLPPLFVKFSCHPSGFCNRRIERLCRIIVHDPSMGSLHDMDACENLP